MPNSTQLPTRSFLFNMILLPGRQGPPVICQVGRVCVSVPKDTENVSEGPLSVSLVDLAAELGPLAPEATLTFSLEPELGEQTTIAQLARVYSTCGGLLTNPLYREIHPPQAMQATVAELFPRRRPGSVCKLYLAAAHAPHQLATTPKQIRQCLKDLEPIIVRLR